MARKIIWSPLAESDLGNILEYLSENWDDKVLNNFINIVDNLISQIVLNPKQYPLIHKKKKVRKCVLTKHNSLFYKIGVESIDILRIFDTRQDPKRIKFS
jgi:plasmid stabilization system protein ParE